MSGGARNYICYQMESELDGRMYDPEINDLVHDIIKLAHSVEWAESDDTSIEDYKKDVSKFKQKWFKESRNDRLKKYIDESIEETRSNLYQMIGVQDDG